MPNHRISSVIYEPNGLAPALRNQLVEWVQSLHPLWEHRDKEQNRQLLRPVYWLGNWQFACLDYYHPPRGILNRCVTAETFPPPLRALTQKLENRARKEFPPSYFVKGWRLNTCLVNYYGTRIENGKRDDMARVGEHRDFEPGPVGSYSLGESALFQFVKSHGRGHPSQVVYQTWLEDNSLLLFAGRRFKDELFHRVQRVGRGKGHRFQTHFENFETRRINFTFRYVPPQHIVRYRDLPKASRDLVKPYMKELAEFSDFFKGELMMGKSPSE